MKGTQNTCSTCRVFTVGRYKFQRSLYWKISTLISLSWACIRRAPPALFAPQATDRHVCKAFHILLLFEALLVWIVSISYGLKGWSACLPKCLYHHSQSWTWGRTMRIFLDLLELFLVSRLGPGPAAWCHCCHWTAVSPPSQAAVKQALFPPFRWAVAHAVRKLSLLLLQTLCIPWRPCCSKQPQAQFYNRVSARFITCKVPTRWHAWPVGHNV